MQTFPSCGQYLNAGRIPLRLQILEHQDQRCSLRERSRCARHCGRSPFERAPRPFGAACCLSILMRTKIRASVVGLEVVAFADRWSAANYRSPASGHCA